MHGKNFVWKTLQKGIRFVANHLTVRLWGPGESRVMAEDPAVRIAYGLSQPSAAPSFREIDGCALPEPTDPPIGITRRPVYRADVAFHDLVLAEALDPGGVAPPSRECLESWIAAGVLYPEEIKTAEKLIRRRSES